MRRRASTGAALLIALTVAARTVAARAQEHAPSPAPAGAHTVYVTLVGTNDVHGHLDSLPVLAGYVETIRAERGRDHVVLLDAGDMFQGTLESNLVEGAPMVAAYNALGYAAVAVGNHEFDFGPVGEPATPHAPTDDARGALRQRAGEAHFPFLMANIVDARTGRPPDWQNFHPSVMLEVAGVKVGVVGVSTEATLHTTIAANVVGLEMRPLAATIATEARALRARGADLVVVTAHAGGNCSRFDYPNDVSSCDTNDEIFRVARELPDHLVDVIIGGHTHARVAHFANGIAIVESGADGAAFDRVDVAVDLGAHQVTGIHIAPPTALCNPASPSHGASHPCPTYDGHAITPDARIAELLAPAYDRARELRARPVGVTLAETVTRSYDAESALGNLFTDLMLRAHPHADIAITNGGALRATLPRGPLTYGALFEAMPFDNRPALVRFTGADLASLFKHNLSSPGGVLSISGARVHAHCADGTLTVTLEHADGRPISDSDSVTAVTSDFLATGGDHVFHEIATRTGAVTLDYDAPTLRDEMARVLGERGGTLHASDFFDPAHPRLDLPSERPVRCAASASALVSPAPRARPLPATPRPLH